MCPILDQPVDIFHLCDIRPSQDCDHNVFYTSFRSAICSHLDARNHEEKNEDRLVSEQQILPPRFEELLIVWYLEKIDPRLPKHVGNIFSHCLVDNVTLVDIQQQIFDSIQNIVKTPEQKLKCDSFDIKSEELSYLENCSDEPKKGENFETSLEYSLKTEVDVGFDGPDFLREHQLENEFHFESMKCNEVEIETNENVIKSSIPRKKKPLTKSKNCDKCKKSFVSQKQFEKHKCFAEKDCQGEQKLKKQGLSCLQCDTSFATKEDLNAHICKNPKQRKFVCPECGKILGSKNSLTCHVNRHNKVDNSWACHVCGKLYNHRDSLRAHMMRHKTNLKCDKCDRTFIDEDRLKKHVCKHFSCNQCDKQFVKERNLKMHMRTHSGETMYSCGECESLFDTKRKLNKHKNGTHKDQWKYKCDECPKVFKGSITLRTHKLRHRGEKPFTCEVCDKCFFQKSNLESHMMVHTNEYPFPCNACGLRFRCVSNVKYHVETTRCGLPETNSKNDT